MYTDRAYDAARRRGEELIEIVKCWRDVEQVRLRMEERRRQLGERYDEFLPALLALRYLDAEDAELQPGAGEDAEALAREVAAGLAAKLAESSAPRGRTSGRRPLRLVRQTVMPRSKRSA